MNLHELSNSLKFDERTIVDVIKKMTIIELIIFDGDNLKLTDSGRDYALRIVRVHRLWEKYLAEKTGFDKWSGTIEQKIWSIN